MGINIKQRAVRYMSFFSSNSAIIFEQIIISAQRLGRARKNVFGAKSIGNILWILLCVDALGVLLAISDPGVKTLPSHRGGWDVKAEPPTYPAMVSGTTLPDTTTSRGSVSVALLPLQSPPLNDRSNNDRPR